MPFLVEIRSLPRSRPPGLLATPCPVGHPVPSPAAQTPGLPEARWKPEPQTHIPERFLVSDTLLIWGLNGLQSDL